MRDFDLGSCKRDYVI